MGLRRQTVAVSLAVAFTALSAAPAFASDQEQQWEMQVGQQQYMQLVQRGEIVPQSPYYSVLQAVGKKVAAVANKDYFAPFHFILINKPQPNAMAVPGGNVYVTTGMMSFVKNQDELASVLCHEVNHDIHHDVYNENQKQQHLQTAAGALGGLIGAFGGYGMGPYLGQMAVGVGAQSQMMKYSRQAEANADRAGAYTCAKAGFNPWAAVWLFQQYQGAHQGAGRPQWMSDHPSDGQRVAALENLFDSDQATFGKYLNDVSTGKPLPKIQDQPVNPYDNPYQRPTIGYGSPQQPPQGYGYPQQQMPQGPPPGYGYPQQQMPQGPPPGYGYPQQQMPQGPPPGYGYPQQQMPQGPPPGYGYPQQQMPPPGYGYPQYPPPQAPPPGYGYPQQQMPPPGYGYPQYPPPQAPPPGYGYP